MTAVSRQILEVGLAAERPTYVYDLARLRQQCRAVEGIPFPRTSIFFATMANDHPAILTVIRQRDHGIFVNSPKHLRIGLGLGFAPTRIVYAASNMVAEEMRLCADVGVHVVLDSIGQLREFGALSGGGLEVGLRVNVGSCLDGDEIRLDPGYRFGVLADELPSALDTACRHGLRIVGVHSYFGTDVMSSDILLHGLDQLGRVAGGLPSLRYIDAGGGFGVPSRLDAPSFDIAEYGRKAAAIMRQHEQRLGRSLGLYIEPGRYLSAGCGFFFVRVVDRKERDDRVFVGTNGSVAIFPRPLLYPEHAKHPCEVLGRPSATPAHPLPIWLCGNSTYSRDFLARAVSLPLPEIRDVIVFHNAGAYCRSMISNFLGKDCPAEVVLDTASDDGEATASEALLALTAPTAMSVGS